MYINICSKLVVTKPIREIAFGIRGPQKCHCGYVALTGLFQVWCPKSDVQVQNDIMEFKIQNP